MDFQKTLQPPTFASKDGEAAPRHWQADCRARLKNEALGRNTKTLTTFFWSTLSTTSPLVSANHAKQKIENASVVSCSVTACAVNIRPVTSPKDLQVGNAEYLRNPRTWFEGRQKPPCAKVDRKITYQQTPSIVKLDVHVVEQTQSALEPSSLTLRNRKAETSGHVDTMATRPEFPADRSISCVYLTVHTSNNKLLVRSSQWAKGCRKDL